MTMCLSGRDEHRVMKAMAGKPGMAKRQEPARANGDCGVDGVNSVGNRSLNEPRGWSWFRCDLCGCATA